MRTLKNIPWGKPIKLVQMKACDVKDFHEEAELFDFECSLLSKVKSIRYSSTAPITLEFKTCFAEAWQAQVIKPKARTRSLGSWITGGRVSEWVSSFLMAQSSTNPSSQQRLSWTTSQLKKQKTWLSRTASSVHEHDLSCIWLFTGQCIYIRWNIWKVHKHSVWKNGNWEQSCHLSS